MHLSSIQLACAALVVVAVGAAASPSFSYHVTRRDFVQECKGTYDVQMFTRLTRLCEDCYNMYKEVEVYTNCRKDCFTGDYFKDCVEVLQETDHLEEYKDYVRKLHGSIPDFFNN